MFGAEFDVRTAATAAEATRMLADCAADIIISDQKMPDIRGMDFLRQAARSCPASFRIILTGQIGVGEVMSEISAGIVHAFLAKPWTERQMRELLARACIFLDRQTD